MSMRRLGRHDTEVRCDDPDCGTAIEIHGLRALPDGWVVVRQPDVRPAGGPRGPLHRCPEHRDELPTS